MQNPAWKCRIRRIFPESGEFFQNPVRFSNSGNFLFFFFPDFNAFFIPATYLAQLMLTLTQNRLNRFFRRVESGLGPKPTRLNSWTALVMSQDELIYKKWVKLQVNSFLLLVKKFSFKSGWVKKFWPVFAMSIINTQSQQLAVITKEV